ncbi:ribosome maturation factor RimM [Alphaproteobacteria bacterium]|nr:ribosome maturation factor RimM [Alphaproteobacteria bacterium]MDB2371044.1 ribosome maturation factor RimM [Alphaproteobacteria bacterium]
MSLLDNFIQVGKIGRPKGTKGLLRLHCFLNDNRDINQFQKFYLEDETIIKVKLVSFDSKSPLVTINDISDRNQIEGYVNQYIYLHKEKLSPTDENEFYFHDLEGLDVVNQQNEIVGKVESVVNFGAGDLLEIYFLKSSKKEFFRFTETNFPKVDVKEKKIMIKS